MAPVEIEFLSSGWEKFNKPVEKMELVTPEDSIVGKEFQKGGKHFRVVCGTETTEEVRRFSSPISRDDSHRDDGAVIHFWDESTHFIASERSSLTVERGIGSSANALIAIGKSGSVKLMVDGVDVAEIRHVSR